MSEPTSTTLAIGWKILSQFFPSVIGSFLAVVTMKFGPNVSLKTKIITGTIAFISGIATSHYLGGLIIGFYPITEPLIQDGIKFALGIFGLTIINNVYDQINPWLTSIRKKILGAENA